MRLQKMQMQLMLAGLGATFLLGSPARGQQEVDPTMFESPARGQQEVDPTMLGESSVISQFNTSSAPQKARNSGAEKKGEKQVASLTNHADKDATLEANVSRMMAEEIAIFATLLVGIAAIVVYVAAATRHENQLQVSPDSAPYTTTTSA